MNSRSIEIDPLLLDDEREFPRVLQQQANIFADEAKREQLHRAEENVANSIGVMPTGTLFQNSSFTQR